MNSRKRHNAAILSFVLCVAILSFAVYAALETGHECYGENCPVCSVLYICGDILSGLFPAAVCAGAVIVALSEMLVCAAPGKICPDGETPISLKVKMTS